MTITYSLDISSSTFLGIHRLLFRWRGSIWKSILPELTVWLFAYFVLSFTYRFAMDGAQQRYFEKLCKFFGDYIEYIPITFMLGFYVSAVFGRWGQIFDNLGWIDSPALLLATYVRGTDEEARRIRRNVVRYLILTQAMVYRDISSCVQKRFPTMDHLVTAGIMTANELKEFDAVPSANIKYWTPIQWAFLLLQRARDKKMIESDIIYTDMLEKLRQFRVNVLTLTLFDWVPIPLVYTQVVNLAVRSYFIVALLGRQYMVESADNNNIRTAGLDLYIPIMTILQFLFYIGWIKVAEVLLNPLGEDDDDFETNWIIDRNLQVGLSIVDDCYGRVPDLERDVFWEAAVPEPLYTPESAARPHNPMVGSCNDVSGQEDALLIQPRRRRLMSTMTSYDNAAFFKQSNGPSITVETDDGTEIVPVENHNPARRTSVCAMPFNESSHGRILDSVRRKFSRAANSRRDSISSATEFDRTMNGRLTAGDDSRRVTPRESFSHYTPAYNPGHPTDSLPVPFTQSLNLSSRQTSRPKVPSGLSESNPQEKFNEYINSFNDYNNPEEEEDEHAKNRGLIPAGAIALEPGVKSPYQSNIWTINESMLPIIEEVQERLRRNAKDTESIHSTDSSLSSRPSSRKVTPSKRKRNGKKRSFQHSFNEENSEDAESVTGNGANSTLKSGITRPSGTTTTTLAPIVTTTETTSSTTNSRPSTTMAKQRDMDDENDEKEEESDDDDEPSLFSQSPPLPWKVYDRRDSMKGNTHSSSTAPGEPHDKRSDKIESSMQDNSFEKVVRKTPILSASNSPRPSLQSLNLTEAQANSLRLIAAVNWDKAMSSQELSNTKDDTQKSEPVRNKAGKLNVCNPAREPAAEFSGHLTPAVDERRNSSPAGSLRVQDDIERSAQSKRKKSAAKERKHNNSSSSDLSSITSTKSLTKNAELTPEPEDAPPEIDSQFNENRISALRKNSGSPRNV